MIKPVAKVYLEGRQGAVRIILRRMFCKYIERMGTRVDAGSRRSCLKADSVISGAEFCYNIAGDYILQWRM
jgi:hypothetical protein